MAEQTPAASTAKMKAIAALPKVEVRRSPGTLGLAEEYGPEMAVAVLPFLQAT